MGTKFSTCDLKVGDVRTFNARDICEIYFERFLLPIANTLKCYLKIWYIQTFEHIFWIFFIMCALVDMWLESWICSTLKVRDVESFEYIV